MNLDEAVRRNKYTMHVGPVDIGYVYGVTYHAAAKKAITIKAIVNAVCRECGIKKSSLLGRAKSDYYVRPRQLAMLVIRELLPQASAPDIGRIFGRDHTTILHGIKRARERIDWCDDTREAYVAIRAELGVPMEEPEKVRNCMFCGNPFQSKGPGNRLCTDERCLDRRQTLSYSMGA